LSLSNDQIYKKSSPEQIVKVLREERFKGLIDTQNIRIESKSWKSLFRHNKLIVFDATIYLTRTLLREVGLSKIVKVLKSEMYKSSFGTGMVSLKSIKNGLIDPTVWKLLLIQGIQVDVVATQSILHSVNHPFCMDRNPNIRKLLFWYSSNSRIIPKIGLKESPNLLSSRNLLNFNYHLVWNESQRIHLENIQGVNAIVCGSIVFQERVISCSDIIGSEILFFEVAPLDHQDVFYSSAMSISTLLTLVSVVKKVSSKLTKPVTLSVKPKRRYSKRQNADYVETVYELESNGDISILDPNLNLYETISNAKLVIAPPYSSPAVIALEMGVKSIYFAQNYDPFDLLSIDDGIEIVVDADRLEAVIESIFI
jgi:polysaccharide biosynthesis PFTS motif protein